MRRPDAAWLSGVKAIFHSVPFIVDIDDSYGHPRPGLRLVPDRDRLEALRVSDHEVYNFIAAALGGEVVGYAHRGEGRDPLEISVRLPQSARSWGEGLAAMPVAQSQGAGRAVGVAGRSGHGDPGAWINPYLPARWPRRRHGARRTGRRL